jgi:hypothetical protein
MVAGQIKAVKKMVQICILIDKNDWSASIDCSVRKNAEECNGVVDGVAILMRGGIWFKSVLFLLWWTIFLLPVAIAE